MLTQIWQLPCSDFQPNSSYELQYENFADTQFLVDVEAVLSRTENQL